MQNATRGFSTGALVAALAIVWVEPALAAEREQRRRIHPIVEALHEGSIEHCDEAVTTRDFTAAFDCGDELFEARFNALDGAGANVGDGGRFSRVPRADLTGFGQWANHTPERATGPNAEACNACHNEPFDDGAGRIEGNVIRDPQHSAAPGKFIQRNTPHLFAPGAVQLLAEEMNAELLAVETAAIAKACSSNRAQRRDVTMPLRAKGVSFGSVQVETSRHGGSCPRRVTRNVRGIDSDLVVRPFQWKGVEAFVRSFNRGASHNELGMQAVEIVGDGVDGDFDGVADEMTIADQTALAVYLAAQPRPTSLIELDGLRRQLEALGAAGAAEAEQLGLPSLSDDQIASIAAGEAVFARIGCATCHVPELRIDSPIFSEPSQNPNYRDRRFPAGQSPVARGVDPAQPILFDLTTDQPDNVIEVDGQVVARLGSFPTDAEGRARVALYGDLKRHDIGVAENIDETGHGVSVFLTENLWGVGSTAPYLHDGRATTLTEATLEHGGQGAASRDAFLALAPAEQAQLIGFLQNLVLFKVKEE